MSQQTDAILVILTILWAIGYFVWRALRGRTRGGCCGNCAVGKASPIDKTLKR